MAGTNHQKESIPFVVFRLMSACMPGNIQVLAQHKNHRLKSVKSHLKNDGLTPRVNGNTKKLPHNITPFEKVQHVVKFILSYAEDHTILLPGHIPGYKRDDI